MIITTQHIGRRVEQEDSFYAEEKNGAIFALVADGLGGADFGGIASNLIASEAKKIFDKFNLTPDNAINFLNDFFINSYNAIVEKNKELNIESLSTLAALLIVENTVYFLHCGDSRIYHFRNDCFISRTKDHSVVQALYDNGVISESEMETHPSKNQLTKCVGIDGNSQASFTSFKLTEGDWFLLCTDGFWQNSTLEEMICLQDASEEIADILISRTLQKGGENCDNITFISIYPKK